MQQPGNLQRRSFYRSQSGSDRRDDAMGRSNFAPQRSRKQPSDLYDIGQMERPVVSCGSPQPISIGENTVPFSNTKENNERLYSQKNASRQSGPANQSEQQITVAPPPDLTFDSSEDDEDMEEQLEQEQRNMMQNRRSGSYDRNRTPTLMPDPSSIYAKAGDLLPHKAPPFKQAVIVKVTWTASQRDFYVEFVNEEKKYAAMARDIAQEDYSSLLGRKVEEGQPCMVLKNGDFYRAILESSRTDQCRLFLVDFGGYMMLPKNHIAPMLRCHAELPMAAVHCAIA
ncbi:unnamed protein product [Gongylonema pulchrum]|uniref:Tudor domain-containing protein n=1 Tax=Gongylonema pulchrum TaxID=637853 RepID=A0A183DTH1_9BILA|nr:unnamed protein product [Gongylonema pulchrum]